MVGLSHVQYNEQGQMASPTPYAPGMC